MYIYFGSSIEGTIILLIVSIALTALIVGILGLSAYILVVLNKIRQYIKRRGDK
jgi:archaellum component FlaG (FlaF/FlaG flagellin family)